MDRPGSYNKKSVFEAMKAHVEAAMNAPRRQLTRLEQMAATDMARYWPTLEFYVSRLRIVPAAIRPFPKHVIENILREEKGGFEKLTDQTMMWLSIQIDSAAVELGGWDLFFRGGIRSPKDLFDEGQPGKLTPGMIVNAYRSSIRMHEDTLDQLAFPELGRPCLVFRPFYRDIEEYRCFVRSDRVVAIAAHPGNKSSAIGDKKVIADSIELMKDFRGGCVALPYNFVFDMVYVDGKGHGRLLEINPWGCSDPLAFKDYATLDSLEKLEFRRK